MASMATLTLNPNPLVPRHSTRTTLGSVQRNHHLASSFSAFNRQILHSLAPLNVGSTNWSSRAASGSRRYCLSASVVCAASSFDVVVVGAGIVGLTIARQFLLSSDLSVAVVDASLPCSGATGAGQGYVWMTHKNPQSDVWDLAVRSQQLWQALADEIEDGGGSPLEELGWMKTGSLLVGTDEKESNTLKNKVEQLSSAGLRAEYLSHAELVRKEPELLVSPEGSAAFLPEDAQLDANRTVGWIEKGNRHFVSQGRYAEFYNDPAISFIRSGKNGNVTGIKTQKNSLYSTKAIIVAAGCWTGSLMHELVGVSDVKVNVPVEPRKGYLLSVENFGSVKLNHAVMEVGYTDHVSPTTVLPSSSVVDRDLDSLSISMTATMDAKGNLLLGSSRQFAGFNTTIDMRVIDGIWNRVGDFFPTLRALPLAEAIERGQVRVGLRPYMPDGKPVIGPIPRMPNVFLSAGHEGGGISMSLGTAELVVDMVLGNPTKIDQKPFAVEGRCC